MADNKAMINAALDTTVIVSIMAGIDTASKKTMNKGLIANPTNSVKDFAVFVAVLGGASYIKSWLQSKKYLPSPLYSG